MTTIGERQDGKDICTITSSNKYITLRIDIDGLKFAVENNPEILDMTAEVKNKRKFAEEMVARLLEHDIDDTGAPAFYRMLDEIYLTMIEDDHESLRIKFDGEED